MNSDPSDPARPRLRGLAPAKVLGVLEGATASAPAVPGWKITGVAGNGGFGTVWKAARESDGSLAAIKIARPDDPETLERIEAEASVLASLDHPDIVRLLDTGPMDDSEGGLFLAMEFIDGVELSQLIPPQGIDPDQAFRWFLRIAAAVAHAHVAGVLHRDLKPGNILVDAAGGIHVADFGLALPIHRRVHQLSLTRAGMIAGTAEYLPPEAYHRGYRPAVSADIFALGVILYEMLRGSPPRGAWSPVSFVRHVDVRIDEIIRRALDPEPSRRFPDVRSMMQELERVLASPPRYHGAPLVSRSVRTTDLFWTLLGIAALGITIAGIDHYNRTGGDLGRRFLGVQGRLSGGLHALFLGLTLLLPVSLWQILRLWRFRGVPMREALPAPFGIALSFSRSAALISGAAQGIVFAVPVAFCFILFLDTCGSWLRPGDPPWAHGLSVVSWGSDGTVLSPWRPGESGSRYWLIESFGPPGNPLCQVVARNEFFPLLVPLGMVLFATVACLAATTTVVMATLGWWRRKRRAAALCIAALAVAFAVLAVQRPPRLARLLLRPRPARPNRIQRPHRSPPPWLLMVWRNSRFPRPRNHLARPNPASVGTSAGSGRTGDHHR
jgi:hypothetical protein